MSRKLVYNAALVAVAMALLVGIHMVSGTVTNVQAQTASSSPSPTPSPTPTPTPTPSPNLCSPGFWKNHQNLWYGPDYCGETSAQTLCDLQPQCHNDPAARQAAAACIEASVGHLCDE